MINILDVIYALIKRFKSCVPSSKHYMNLPEDYNTPSFLYRMVFRGDSRQSKHVKDVTLDMQIILFTTRDEYGKEDNETKLRIAGQLSGFLDTFVLKVGDRHLKFDYSFGEADEQLTINIDFKFKDGVIDSKFDADQAMDMIERIFINEKEVI